MWRRYITAVIIGGGMVIGVAGMAGAMTISILADTTGWNVGYVTGFWGVNYVSGGGFIESVTFDVSKTGGLFDFDGSPFLAPLIPGDEPKLAGMYGLSPGDITYPRAVGGTPVGNPPTLKFNFAYGSFAPGDWFRFSADVDNDPTTGGQFGDGNTFVSVKMFWGEIYTTPFLMMDQYKSVAVLSFFSTPTPHQQPVPEPTTIFLMGTGGLGIVGIRRTKK